MNTTRPLKAALASFACLALAACGTTLDDKAFTEVAVDANGNPITSADGSLGLDGSVPGAAGGAGGVGGATAGSGGVTGGAGGSPSGSGGAGTPGAPGTVGTTPNGTPGEAPTKVDPDLDPVEVGVFYYTGVQLSQSNDPVAQPKAVIKYLNDNGGIGGHEVVGVYTPVDATSPAPYASTLQRVCDEWTQDHDVIAGISTGNAPIDLIRCLNDRGVVGVTGASFLPKGQVDYAALPYMVDPSWVMQEVQNRALVDSLWRRGFFEKGDKIGVFYLTMPGSAEAYKRALVPQLAKYGLKVQYSFAAEFPKSTPEVASALASLQAPTLRMKNEGVTKILFAGTGEFTTVSQYADEQEYYPQYGYTTQENPYAKERMAHAPRVMPGSMGIGWQPLLDQSNPAPSNNAAAQECLKIMQSVGGTADAVQQWAAQTYCDTIRVLAAGGAMNPAEDMTGEALLAGINRIGSTYQSPFTTGTFLVGDKRWGASMARDFAWNPDCGCNRYVGAPYKIG